MIYLKELNEKDSLKECAFFSKMPSMNGFMNDYHRVSYDDFVSQVIPERMNYAKGIGLKPNHVPDTYFFLWDDDEIIGLFKIRHYLTEGLRNGSGHVGYGILPEHQGKGYASKGLALAIEKCRELLPADETEIYLACWKENTASLKVMLKNGAYIHHTDEDEYYTRIKLR